MLRGGVGMSRMFWLSVALLPYLLVAGWDAYLHERVRKVPTVEKWVHALLAVLLLAFVSAVFTARTQLALVLLAAFALVAVWDAFGFHALLSRHERRVHAVANSLLLGFIVFWIWFDGVIA